MPTTRRARHAILPPMNRRNWLKLGMGSAVVLAMGGGWVASIAPGWRDGAFSADAQMVLRACGKALLAGSLPADAAAESAALDGLLQRLADAVAALPPHAQAELSELLALMGTSAGRQLLGGVSAPWQNATVPQVQAGLQDMRFSRISLRQQAYQALHDLTGAAYFSSPQTWTVLGYPGPRDL
jgi:hypothetical protein